MKRSQQQEERNNLKINWAPGTENKDHGQFKVYRLDELADANECIPYIRRDFYKISLINGHTHVYYADKSMESKQSALLFSNSLIPYSWVTEADRLTGFSCLFSETFFTQLAHIKEYPVFKPGDNPLFLVSEKETEAISHIFRKMLAEVDSDFTYKYDLLRNMVLELVFIALKTKPAASHQYNDSNAAARVAALFTQLLERQFPVESSLQQMKLRSPSDFAEHLSIHVNHLNRSLKEITDRTTSQLIGERVSQEARSLLKHTDWNISEIGWCLGFEELTHFTAFFKKHTGLTPKVFRKSQAV